VVLTVVVELGTMSGFQGGPMANAPDRFLTWRWEEEEDEEKYKLKYNPDSKRPNAGTFILQKEDHTIGNLLRMQLLSMKDDIKFAGYRCPHPLVLECHVRVETMDSKFTPIKAFEVALDNMQHEAESLRNTFRLAVEEFENNEQAYDD
tara:strand:+ start:135 stop:578 length:444 start_codon:yes stop_codon:yes gene_type:complete